MDDPSVASHLKQGEVVMVLKKIREIHKMVPFIVRYYEQHDAYNNNWFVCAFTQELNKELGKPKSYLLEEVLVFNKDNMDKFLFCEGVRKRYGMRKAAARHSQLTEHI